MTRTETAPRAGRQGGDRHTALHGSALPRPVPRGRAQAQRGAGTESPRLWYSHPDLPRVWGWVRLAAWFLRAGHPPSALGHHWPPCMSQESGFIRENCGTHFIFRLASIVLSILGREQSSALLVMV